MESDVNTRSLLAAACRDQDFEEARHLIAAGANPKGSTCGFFNWTALHYCCQYGELMFVKELIETYGINPEAEDKEGRTPLHIASQFGHIPIAQYLTSKCRCDPDYLDFEEQTPLHHAVGWLSECSEESVLEVAKFLISVAHSDPHRKDLNGKNALLHACEKGYLNVAQYLINDCGSNIADIDNHGNTCLHLAVSYANNLPLVKCLASHFSGNIPSPNGNTLLHAACAANSSVDIIKYLLITAKCDPNSRNEKGIQPLDVTTKNEIKRLLYMHGATPENVLEKHGAVLSNLPTTGGVKAILKVLVVGKQLSGKTTMIKAIQREGSSFVYSFSQQRTTKYEEQTKSLQVVGFHNKLGHFNFFDFAGNDIYKCSHSAILRHVLYYSTATIILVINLRESIEELKGHIFDWMSLIAENCSTIKSKLRVLIVGSHCDVVKYDVSRIWKEINIYQQLSRFSKLEILGNIALDCQRSDSPGMTKLRQHLDVCYQQLCSPEAIHFNAQCLHDIFETKYVASLAISVKDLCHQVSVAEDSNVSCSSIEYFIPSNKDLLTDLCIYMNNLGLTIYIHGSNCEKSFVILNRQLFFNIITTVFTPKPNTDDNNPGIISLSTLLPLRCDTNTAVDVLMQLEVCQAIPVNCKVCNIQKSRDIPVDMYIYFPALASIEFPNSVWEFKQKFKCHFGWTLRFGTKTTSRFIEILLVRMSSSFFQVARKEKTQFMCWKHGIHGSIGQDCEFIAEVNSGAILIIMRSSISSLSYLKLRSQLIWICLNAVNEFYYGIVTEELFIDPFEVVQYPLKPSSFVAHFAFSETVKAIANFTATVKSTTGDELSVTDLIGHDPYVDLGPHLTHYFSKDYIGDPTISDEYMHQLGSKMDDNGYLTELFLLNEDISSVNTNPTNSYQVLVRWCNLDDGTYQSLCQVLGQASVFINR